MMPRSRVWAGTRSARTWPRAPWPSGTWKRACGWTSTRSSGSPTGAGRRPRLVGTGKDVWEIIAAVRDNDGDAAETARYLEIPLGLVQAAISYYGAYREEIDQWIEANEQQAAEAHAAWSAGQDAIRP